MLFQLINKTPETDIKLPIVVRAIDELQAIKQGWNWAENLDDVELNYFLKNSVGLGAAPVQELKDNIYLVA